MTWSRTDHLSSVRTDGLFPDRIYILCANGWPSFRTDDMFPNRIYILHTNFILRMDYSHLNGLFIPCTNDSPYDLLRVRMTPRTNYWTLNVYLRSGSVNKLMSWSWTDYPYKRKTYSRTEYLFSVRTDDPLSEQMTCSQTESLCSHEQ